MKKFFGLNPGNKKEWVSIFFIMELALMMLILSYWSGNKWGVLGKSHSFLEKDDVILLVMFLSGSIGLIGMYILKEFLSLTEKEKELEIQNFKFKQMEETNELLQSQRHDFLNNIQVVMGLIQLDHIDKAKEYLKNIGEGLTIKNKDIKNLDQIQYPHLNTLFSNKFYQCRELGIAIAYDIEVVGPLKSYGPMDLIRVFGNLLDNAIYEVKSLRKELKKINVSLYEDTDELVFEVYNLAPIIPRDLQKRIFDPGFTTKENEGTGMGLYNVKNIVQKYGGRIELVSEEKVGTIFTIRLPLEEYSKEEVES